ncbi:hypothetical protein [Streptomyces prunicolor]|uniref:Uncharacterized protein n=1 Tax=Streptomyces prunicolor TaxID=67348 RepID=A0ABU4FDU2_9ACTN|nr:hypothetical protein [Streptomyces prunicolor]MDV7218752.1 hypothetical protein [Streptomyces prunicolor]
MAGTGSARGLEKGAVLAGRLPAAVAGDQDGGGCTAGVVPAGVGAAVGLFESVRHRLDPIVARMAGAVPAEVPLAEGVHDLDAMAAAITQDQGRLPVRAQQPHRYRRTRVVPGPGAR